MSKQAQRRYYLHRKFREKETLAKLVSKEKTIYLGAGLELTSKYSKLLMDQGYAVQYTIE